MNLLRIVLLGLAAAVLGALGWRLGAAPPHPSAPHPVAAMASSQPVPKPPAEVLPPAAPPAGQAAPAGAPALQAQTPPETPAHPETQAMVLPPPVADAHPAANISLPGMTAQDAHGKIVAVLAAAPDLARAFDALRAQFPAVADRTLSEATEAYRTSGVAPTPDDLFASGMRDLRLSAGVLAAKAGPEALGAIFEVKAKVLADLEQADPRICADYLYGGTSPEFADFQAAHRSLIATAALATIDAMADGRSRQKAWGEPSADDFQVIETALAKRGLSQEEIASLLDGRAPNTPPTDERLCDNARTYLDVLKAMPADARNRVYGLTAELLARS